MSSYYKTNKLHKSIVVGRISIAVFTIILILISVIPASMIEAEKIVFFKGFDKLVHIIMYASLMIVWILSIKKPKEENNNSKYLIIGMLYCTFIGIFTEILQYLTNLGRSFEILDIFADITGILLVIIFFNYKKLIK
ncbi:MAG: VanZ family protein [Saprospiraceae bacterium]